MTTRRGLFGIFGLAIGASALPKGAALARVSPKSVTANAGLQGYTYSWSVPKGWKADKPNSASTTFSQETANSSGVVTCTITSENGDVRVIPVALSTSQKGSV